MELGEENVPQIRRVGIVRTIGLRFILPCALTLIVGTAWHEIVGHGLMGVICGGHVANVHVLGFEVWPSFEWEGWKGYYGYCSVPDIPTPRGELLMALAGSMSTWLVGFFATMVFCSRRWTGWSRAILIWLSIWWLDLFSYTLPTLGIRHSIVWGSLVSEPYEAAVALGLYGPAFQWFAFGSGLLLGIVLLLRLRHQPAATASGSSASLAA